METIKRTTSDNCDFIDLVKQLDAYLKVVDGADHDFYNQYNGLEALQNVVVIYLNDIAVGCGAFKPYNSNTVEIKRMYSNPSYRNQGIATKVLQGLENWATELNYNSCILETGKRQVEAVAFYQKCGYNVIPNYGQYTEMENSICFEKML
ncbi:MAG: GNAT family N-acetyltransferase [Vicingaceae bacterium]|nr:GNAT family N-acetyltransferase [Vicingaceae bacterium]